MLANIGNLQEVIDWDHVASMLDQGDHYAFGRVSVLRRGDLGHKWYVYVGNKEHHVYEDEEHGEPSGYETLAEALGVALSLQNHERWFPEG